MAGPKNAKRKLYARYAAHCLHMVTAAKDQDSRTIQREMAAEWLRLADDVQNPLQRTQTRMK
jgi:hypothetical protein